MGIIKSYIKREHTDLNTLKYKDSDTIGKPPIVQKRIPSTIESRVPNSNELSRRIDDLKRIAVLFTRPEGIKFLGNEAALNTINLSRDAEPGLKGKLKMAGKGLFSGVKTIASTLAQVPVNGTGTHFVKGFLPKSKTYIRAFDETVKKESRLRHGDPAQNAKRSAYNSRYSDITADKINFENPIVGQKAIYGKIINSNDLNDLIKFRFTVVTPEEEVMLPFRAYLTSFNDNYSSEWAGQRYLGRAENFYTYQGFDRSIQIGFKIAAQTRHEMRPLYRKMVYLASSTAPTYSKMSETGNGGIMRGTFVRLTVGSYVYNIPGFIENLSYTWNEDYPWEIALNVKNKDAEGENPDYDQQELPMVMDCNLTFKPIHTFAPQAGLYNFITQGVVNKGKEDKLFLKDGEIVTSLDERIRGELAKPNPFDAGGIPDFNSATA